MTTTQNIDDDMLSAYLDRELAVQDMQIVHAALVSDPVLAKRFSALQRANALVAQHARALDEIPLRASTLAMLQMDTDSVTPVPANVVRGPWRRWTPLQRALAASLIGALALTFTYLRDTASEGLPLLAAYAQHLDTAPSGTSVVVDDATLTSRFSFRDNAGRYCRQYQLSTETSGAANIACHGAQGWVLVASMPDATTATGAYQPATSTDGLNAVLDSMMDGAALDLATEAALIDKGWQDASE